MNMIKSVCLLAIILQVSRGQSCKSDHPKAFMCQANSVSGPAVTLDVSTAARTNATQCTCSLKSNITGLIVAFNDNPNSTNCGAQLDLLFENISMQLKCGVPADNQSTSGNSAKVIYTREMDVDDVDSKYCLTFYANRTDVSIVLSCAEFTSAAPPMTPSASSSSDSSELLMNSTTTQPQSNSTTTLTTTQPQSNSTTTLTTQPQSNSTFLTTQQWQANSTATQTTTDPSFHSTTVQITTPFNQFANQTNALTTNNSTTNLTTTQSTSMSTTTLTTISSFNSTTPQITLQPLSNLTTSQTYSQSLSYTSTNQTVTQSLSNSTSAPTATQLPPNSTASQITTQSLFNTTTFNSTFYTSEIKRNTTQSSSVNETSTTTSVNSTTRTVFNETSTESNNGTYENVSTTQVTTAQNSNTSSSIYPNATTDYLNGTTTESYDNVTTVSQNETTTDSYGNVTTVSHNETTDNITTEVVTTIRDNTKASSPGFWEPPYQEYGVPSGSTNIVAVIAPVSAILLLVFIGVVVFIMCKRSRKAARRTKTPDNENKTDKNYNYQRPNFLAKDPNDTMQTKPPNPADFFTVQTSDKNPAKITAANELNGNENNLSQTTKALTHLKSVDSFRKLNGDTILESGKPKIYEPNEREKDILDNLELASIVIESDPDDSNRYFKKTDPGDWYRVIMKGKKPRDSEELLDTLGSTKERSKRKNAKSSGSEDNSDREQHRSRKSRSHTEKHQKKHNNHKTSMSSKNKSSDSDEKTYSGTEKKRHLSNTTDAATTVNKSKDQQRKYDDITSSNESVNNGTTVQPKLVISKPLNKETMHSNSQVLIQPKQVMSKPVNERNHEREPVQTRLISSKSSSVTMPVALPRQNSTGNLMNRDLKETDKEKYAKQESSELNSSISRNDGSETSSFRDRNTPQRSSQTRNTLFSSGSKINSQNGGTDNENSESKLKPVKRPDIVPPLNLTGTGDKVGLTDDGFEEFLLN